MSSCGPGTWPRMETLGFDMSCVRTSTVPGRLNGRRFGGLFSRDAVKHAEGKCRLHRPSANQSCKRILSDTAEGSAQHPLRVRRVLQFGESAESPQGSRCTAEGSAASTLKGCAVSCNLGNRLRVPKGLAVWVCSG
eukprot:1189341-Prorocentrum_minimum.AAC.4